MPKIDLSPKGPLGATALGMLRDADCAITIAHMDTGFTEHPVFAQVRGSITLGNDYFDPSNPEALDPLPAKESATDWPGHGTRTLSLLCGQDAHIVGAAPGAKILVCRVADSPVFDLSSRCTEILGNALTQRATQGDCRVVSISMGIPSLLPLLPMGPSKVLGEGIDACYESGIICVAAAGQIIDRVTYPGRYYRSVGVGALTYKGAVWQRYEGSDMEEVDVWAWGHDIQRANSARDSAGKIVYCYTHAPQGVDEAPPHSGTSYATVQVSAAAAMWLAYHGTDLAPYYNEPWRVVEAFKTCLLAMPAKVAGLQSAALDVEALLSADLPNPETLKKAPPAANQKY